VEVNLALVVNEVGVSLHTSEGEFLIIILCVRLILSQDSSSTSTEAKISLKRLLE
jgi:hypothetical protein